MHVYSNNSSTQDQLMSCHHIISTTIHLSTVPRQSSNINLTCHMQLTIKEVSKFVTLLFQQMGHVMSTNIILTLYKPPYLANKYPFKLKLSSGLLFISIVHLKYILTLIFQFYIFQIDKYLHS